jgi:hypothetical protein
LCEIHHTARHDLEECKTFEGLREVTRGGNGSLIKFLSQETGLCPTFKTPSKKTLKESDEK